MTDLIEGWPTTAHNDGGLLLSKQGGIAIVTINEPERRNPMPVERWEAFSALLDEIEADDEARVVIWTGGGTKVFASGADSTQFEKLRTNAAGQRAYEARLTACRSRMKLFTKPVIACIQGYCMGGGMSVAMHADIRVCSEGSRLGIPTAKIGFALSVDPMTQLIGLMGASRARLLTYTGRLLDGRTAENYGLVDICVPEEQLAKTVLDLAAEISRNAPLVVRAAKITINELIKPPAARNLEAITRAEDACADSDDFREGRTAVREKRKPNFTGR